jgi:3',5'-cyclic AMP phosphodiesterase CpdA
MTVTPNPARRPLGAETAILGSFTRPATENHTRVAFVSDLHLSTRGYGTSRALHRTEERLEQVVASLNEDRLDAVVFNGDLVQNGRKAEYDAFDRIVADLDPPLFAVPGNHDLIDRGDGSTSQLTLPEFERRYAPTPFPYRVRIGGVDLIGLSSNASTRAALTDSYSGRVSPSTLEWLSGAMSEATCPIVSVHHTLETAREQYRNEQERLPLENGDCPAFENDAELISVLGEASDPLVVTGHLHVPTVVRSTSVTEFTLPPLGPYPCGYTVLDVGSQGTVASFQSACTYERQAEALALGHESDRTLLAAARMSNLPLATDEPVPET